MKQEELILDLLKSHKSLFLVGPTNSGKTWFVENILIPYLSKNSLESSYFADCDHIFQDKDCDIAVIDEVESLQDKTFLESSHLEQSPCFSEDYLKKIRDWFCKLKNVSIPCVYVVTRNNKSSIDNFINTIKNTDWDERPVKVLEYIGGYHLKN